MILVVVPVIIFCFIKISEGLNGSNNGLIKSSAFIKSSFIFFGFFFFFIIVVKNDTPVLRPRIITLPVQRCGIMSCPENLEQFIKTDFIRTIINFQDFRMTRFLIANLLVGWIFNVTATISTGYFFNPFQLLKNRFCTPEATITKCCRFYIFVICHEFVLISVLIMSLLFYSKISCEFIS